jgi:subtilisin family serine protease
VRRVLSIVTVVCIGLVSMTPAQAAPGPQSAPEYWFDSWHVTQLWHSGVRGQGVTIAEVDTGVNAQLPELKANVLPGTDFGQAGNGHIDREVNAFGHGTAMASIMVGRQGLLGITGLAPDAKILPIAVPLTGTTDAAANDHLPAAIHWAVDHGAKVVSMSLGATRDPATDVVPCPAAEQAAVYYALSKGAVLLAAAGNQGARSNAVEEPGVCLGVVSVGAVDESGTVGGFSSRHRYLTLTAPGVSVPSLGRLKGTAYAGSGTSQATAIASAVIALVWSKYPKLTGRQIVTRVIATLDRHTTRRDQRYGFGTIDAYRAVTNSVTADAPNPVYAAADPFLARGRAFAKAARAARPAWAGTSHKSFGTFSIGPAPRLFGSKVLVGLTVAAGGLLCLIVLLVAAARGARRRPLGAATEPPRASGESMLPPPRDDAGLDWHDIAVSCAENAPDRFPP